MERLSCLKAILLTLLLATCIYFFYLLRVTPLSTRRQISNITDNKTSPVMHFSMLQWWESKGENQTIDLPRNLSLFQSTISLQDQRKLREFFFKVTDVFKQNNISYHLRYGTLIGAYRHYGIIPWDDEIDLYVNNKDKAKIKSLFSDGKHYMTDNTELMWRDTNNVHTKIAIKHVVTHGTRREIRIVWPFIDVFYYTADENKIHYLAFKSVSKFNGYLQAGRVFPLQIWPFEGTFQPVPRDIEYVIGDVFPGNMLEQCKVDRGHRNRRLSTMSVPCSILYPYFPFADHSKSEHVVKI